ncbi:MAG: co-chaperone GroES [Acidothermus sp.]|nr:co-chaperone GroES [Acidothermus sp.]MCL6538060.1 co-chaperone GroES [Acidothermus sp.]
MDRTVTGLPIKLLHDRVLVKAEGPEGERRSSGGIVIPATAAVGRRLVWAEVVGVGQAVRSVQVGDRVLYEPEDRAQIEIHGVSYVLLRERDIHAVAAERVEGSTGLYL